MMRIAIILNSSSPYAGSNKSILLTIKRLDKLIYPIIIAPKDSRQKLNLNYETHYVSYDFDVILSKEKDLNKIKYYIKNLKKYIKQIKSYYKIIATLKKLKPHVIHTNIGPLYGGYFASKILNIPHVWHIREYCDLDFHYKPLYTWKFYKYLLNDKENKIIFTTKQLQQYFSLKSNTFVIRNSVEFDERMIKNHSIPNHENYLLYVGRIDKYKGVTFLLNVMADFFKINNDYKLYLFGEVNDPNYLNEIQKYISQNHLEDRIKIEQPIENLGLIYNNAVATIIPSEFEAFGRVAVEAMNYECLTIGKKSGGTEALLSKNRGILFNNENELLQILIDLQSMSIYDKQRHLKRSKIFVRKKFNPIKNSLKLLKVYQQNEI